MSTLLHVGARPPAFEARGFFLDGISPVPQEASLWIDEALQTLLIDTPDGRQAWPLAAIRELPDQAGGDLYMLRRADDPLQRLMLLDRALAPRLPHARRRAPVTRRGRLFAWAAAAVASVALIVFVLVPVMADQLAEYIPPEGERALGQVTLNQIRDALDQTGLQPVPFCENPDGLAALAAMQDRLLERHDLETPLTVHILNHEMVNAFALPGGHVVLFDGLIDAAGAPEELAAVLAHEVGHVVSRDPTRHALRSAGSIGVLGLLFGDFAGGTVVLFLAERLIDARYSQEAEAAADAFSHRMLLDAGLSPAALAEMFERFRDMDGDAEGMVQHFMAHPALGDRIAAARAATPDGFATRPLLDAPQWGALKRVCD
ncbi:M48 family metalloprotease [Thalassococcus sp. CAU 1522]|uniref:M48 family metalloprotease n=1 Tax=Thalassococcus arenae TaxID=2851652 RepID=A0ABS6N719_9RHOB|nr:M48 family metalloprotease [Thalassococcus arenae]MBV2359808.1 M48 family metalloprotease [Thalassococcus arenae]